ncbi:MAG: hypothetical protein KIT69_07130 [Propionibacteriaceae bacterium]|nr:hypothetical protein [Propionibacteriaceae bacterium]
MLDVVALPTADVSGEVLPAYPHEDQEGPDHFSKFGLLVQADAEFTVSLQHPPAMAVMVWGTGERERYSALHSSGCAGAGWQVFAGGLWLAEPMCAEVLVETAQSAEVVAIAAGLGCP